MKGDSYLMYIGLHSFKLHSSSNEHEEFEHDRREASLSNDMQNIHRHCVDANAVILLERLHRLPVHMGRESDSSEWPAVRASHPD